jgi:hypothetical protein
MNRLGLGVFPVQQTLDLVTEFTERTKAQGTKHPGLFYCLKNWAQEQDGEQRKMNHSFCRRRIASMPSKQYC